MSEQGEGPQLDQAPIVTNPPVEDLSRPAQRPNSSLGLKVAGALATLGLVFGADKATGGHISGGASDALHSGANAAGQMFDRGRDMVQGELEARPMTGEVMNDGKFYDVQFNPIVEKGIEKAPVVRTKPSSDDVESQVDKNEYQKRNIDLSKKFTNVQVVAGDSFAGHYGEVYTDDKGNKYGEYVKIPGLDPDGKPKDYYIAMTFGSAEEVKKP